MARVGEIPYEKCCILRRIKTRDWYEVGKRLIERWNVEFSSLYEKRDDGVHRTIIRPLESWLLMYTTLLHELVDCSNTWWTFAR